MFWLVEFTTDNGIWLVPTCASNRMVAIEKACRMIGSVLDVTFVQAWECDDKNPNDLKNVLERVWTQVSDLSGCMLDAEVDGAMVHYFWINGIIRNEIMGR